MGLAGIPKVDLQKLNAEQSIVDDNNTATADELDDQTSVFGQIKAALSGLFSNDDAIKDIALQ